MFLRFFCSIFLVINVVTSFAQKRNQAAPFSIRLEQLDIDGLPGLQSFAYATWEHKWLLVGGRIDGLHRRQPWASFSEAGQNRHFYVVDPTEKKVWKASMEHLPVNLQEQLQSTNMEFIQVENNLILAGGYGYSKTLDDHITYPYLVVIKVDALIHAIINNQQANNAIVQVKDQRMAVTGGRFGKVDDTLLLVGGQRFDGMYNPMGPDHGPGFEQQYSNEIRKFSVSVEHDAPVIKNYRAIRDSIHLHRRDYNLVPQVFDDGEFGYTAFSGVFQYDKDLPYTNFVDIADGAYKVNHSFKQRFNHYHSAVLPLYDNGSRTMYTVFFGGIAQYYPDANGKIISNEDVPFTKTISLITRKDGKVLESYLPLTMPGYLGAAAEFIFKPGVTVYRDGMADFQKMGTGEFEIGYIVGGINSSDRNIFFSNTGKESRANSQIIKVFIRKN